MELPPDDAFETLSTYARRHEREPIDVPIRLQLILENGELFGEGTGRLRDISAEGALVTDIELEGGALPSGPFTLALKIEGGRFEGVQAEAVPVRFARVPGFGLGVSLTSLAMDVDA